MVKNLDSEANLLYSIHNWNRFHCGKIAIYPSANLRGRGLPRPYRYASLRECFIGQGFIHFDRYQWHLLRSETLPNMQELEWEPCRAC